MKSKKKKIHYFLNQKNVSVLMVMVIFLLSDFFFIEKVVTIITADETEKEVKAYYSDEDLNKLVNFIKNMTTLYDVREEDWREENFDVIREFLLNPKHPLLIVFFDGDVLCCVLDIPETAFVDLTYFLRETPDYIFEVETFHDNITFGTIHEDIEGSLLRIMLYVYAPYFLQIESWPDSILAFCLYN